MLGAASTSCSPHLSVPPSRSLRHGHVRSISSACGAVSWCRQYNSCEPSTSYCQTAVQCRRGVRALCMPARLSSRLHQLCPGGATRLGQRSGSTRSHTVVQASANASPVWLRVVEKLPPVRQAVQAARGVLRFYELYKDVIHRVAVTLVMLMVMRCGHFIPLPGLDPQHMPSGVAATEGERLIRTIYGQVRDLPASLFDLGISPQINASIVLTVLLMVPDWVTAGLPGISGVVARAKEARKEGKSGEAYLNGCTNWMGLAFGVYLALVRSIELEAYALNPGGGYLPCTALALMAGSAITQHCASVVTANGIGNGTTLVIITGIVTGYSETLHNVLSALQSGGLALWKVGGFGVMGYLALVMFTVYLSGSELRLPIVHYGSTALSGKQSQGPAQSQQAKFAEARKLVAKRTQQNDYVPLMINSSGMMPIILASALYFGALPIGAHFLGWQPLVAAVQALQTSALSLVPYGLLVAAMEFVPMGGIAPKDLAEYLGALNVGIQGVVPGQATEAFLKDQLRRCKLWGGLALGGLAVAAHLFDIACSRLLGSTLGTPSLLIIVGAVLQGARQVEALLEGPKLQQRLDSERELIHSLVVL